MQRLYIVLRPESGERTVEEKQDSDSGESGSKKSGIEGGHGSQVRHSLFIGRLVDSCDVCAGNGATLHVIPSYWLSGNLKLGNDYHTIANSQYTLSCTEMKLCFFFFFSIKILKLFYHFTILIF